MNRRNFLVTAPLLAAAGAAAPHLMTSAVAATKPEDAVLAQVGAELLRSYHRAHARNEWRATDARALASHLRMATSAWTADRDAAMRAALDRQIRRRGRDAVLDTPMDHAAFMARLMLTDETMPNPTREQRDDMLTAILSGRLSISRHLASLAALSETTADRLAKQEGLPPMAHLAQEDVYCSIIRSNVLFMETMTFIVCSIGEIAGPEACLIIGTIYLSLKWTCWWSSCGC